MERVAVQPPELAKFHLRSGRQVWETTLHTNIAIESVSPGIISALLVTSYFDPRTGHALTNVSTGTQTQLLFAGKVGFHISDQQTGTLTAIEGGTQNILWKIERLNGVCRILQPYAFGRLLCATDTHVMVVDTANHQIKAGFSLAGLKNARFLQTKYALIAQSDERLRVVNPDMGTTRWELAAGSRSTEVFGGGNDQVLLVERGVTQADRNVTFGVVALDINYGKQRWHWRVPDGHWGDIVGVSIQLCPQGFAVRRHWTVLD